MPFAFRRLAHPITFALAATIFSAAPFARAADPTPIAAPADALVMRPQIVADPYAKMDAVSILVPAGWQMGSTVEWKPGNASGPHIDITVFDPAQSTAVRMYPILFYTDGVRENQKRAIMRSDPSGRMWANLSHFYDEGQPNGPGSEIRQQPKSPRDYVMTLLLPKLRPVLAATKDITLISETDMPEYAKAKFTAFGNPNAVFTASRFRIAYTGPKGAMEEEFVCTIRTQPIGAGAQSTVLWDADVTSALAPKGKLDALLPTLHAVAASKQMQLPYFNFVVQIGQMINQADRQRLQQMIENENQRILAYGEMQRKASAELSQSIRDNFKKQQENKAIAHEGFMHYVNDTSAYTDPHSGANLSLAAGYKFNYINNHGDVIQTNDATFKPPVDPSTSWNTMDKSR